jgi:hypothetical protein
LDAVFSLENNNSKEEKEKKKVETKKPFKKQN